MQHLVAPNEKIFSGENFELLFAQYVVTVRDCVQGSQFRRDGFPSIRSEGLFSRITKVNGCVMKTDPQGNFFPLSRKLLGVILLKDLGRGGIVDFLKEKAMSRTVQVTHFDGVVAPMYRSVPSRRILGYEDICTLKHGIVEKLELDALLISACDENKFFVEGAISKIVKKVHK